MTASELIEKAARAAIDELSSRSGFDIFEDLESGDPETFEDMVQCMGKRILGAIEPGLIADPPTHWIAPWEATFEMSALVDRETEGNCRDAVAREALRIMRAAYLAEPPPATEAKE